MVFSSQFLLKACSEDTECPDDWLCNLNTGNCDQCLEDSDCFESEICDEATLICKDGCDNQCSDLENKKCNATSGECVCEQFYVEGDDGNCTKVSNILKSEVISDYQEEFTQTFSIPSTLGRKRENVYGFCSRARTVSATTPKKAIISAKKSGGKRIRDIQETRLFGLFYRKNTTNVLTRVLARSFQYEITMEEEEQEININYKPKSSRKSGETQLFADTLFNDGDPNTCSLDPQTESDGEDNPSSPVWAYELDEPKTISKKTKFEMEFAGDNPELYGLEQDDEPQQFCLKLTMEVSKRRGIRKIKRIVYETKYNDTDRVRSKYLFQKWGRFDTFDKKVVEERAYHFESRLPDVDRDKKKFSVELEITPKPGVNIRFKELKIGFVTADDKYPCINLFQTPK